ncbi:neprilysin-2-like [Ornithodoros turicata]|uniref:neprilysin-2-like n=1 Tax=Ornithodoros turicata TaxID=34597 RepID=UPI00313A0333
MRKNPDRQSVTVDRVLGMETSRPASRTKRPPKELNDKSEEKRKATAATITGLANLQHSLGQAMEKAGKNVATRDTASPPSRTSRNRMVIGVVATIVTFAIIFIVSYVIARRYLHSGEQLGLANVCSNSNCFAHARALQSGWNTSRDPCDDFGAFVCSAWKSQLEMSFSTSTDMQFKWVDDIVTMLNRGNTHFSATRKAVDLFASCSNRSTVDQDKAQNEFIDLLRSKNIRWPYEPPNVDPLSVLIDLDTNLLADLWFRISIRGRQPNASIVIIPSKQSLFWASNIKRVRGYNKRDEYCLMYYDLLTTGEKPEDKRYCTKLLQVEEEIMFVMADVVSDSVKKVVGGSLKNVSLKHTPNVGAERWLEALYRHYGPKYRFSPNTIVKCDNQRFLETVDSLISTHTNEELLNHIGWWFVQQYAGIAFARANIIHFGDPKLASQYSPTICELLVEDVYRTLIVADHVAKTFTESARKKVDEILDAIENHTMHMFASSPWIDDNSKQQSVAKLKTLKRTLWPAAMTNTKLQDLYSVFPSATFYYMRDWTENAKVFHSLLGEVRYTELTSLPHNIREYPVYYHYVDHAITVAMNTVEAPLFYQDATSSVNYGGLGATYALRIVRVFDPEGIHLSDKGEYQSWWSNSSLSNYTKKVACDSSSFVGIFPEVPALEIAYGAYMSVVSQVPDSLLLSMETYSAEQIFFMSYCHSLCGDSVTNLPVDRCNKALKNFKPFAQAFRCKDGSFMNPGHKCTFF